MPRRRQRIVTPPQDELSDEEIIQNTNHCTKNRILKLPDFWINDPVLWFIQVEAIFFKNNLTDSEGKFNNVISVLPPEVISSVREILLSPSNNSYDVLKSAILKKTTLSDTKRVQQLLSQTSFQTEQPSQILCHMKQLLDRFAPLDSLLIRELFLQRLPPDIRLILAANKHADVAELAEIADSLVDSGTINLPECNSLKRKPDEADQRVIQLSKDVAELKKIVQELNINCHSQGKKNNQKGNQTLQLCWYHSKFGINARKCIQPCNWTGNE